MNILLACHFLAMMKADPSQAYFTATSQAPNAYAEDTFTYTAFENEYEPLIPVPPGLLFVIISIFDE